MKTDCLRCRSRERVHMTVMGPLCVYCLSRWTSVAAHLGMANREPLSQAVREQAWQWFLKTRYFVGHRRMSRGRARKLLCALEAA